MSETVLKDKLVTNIVTYGETEKNKLVVETVASYYNFFNFSNTPTYKTKEYKEKYIDFNGIEQEREISEKIKINYDFDNSPTINLIFSQLVKLVVNGEEKSIKTKQDLARVLTQEPNLVNDIMNDIISNSTFWAGSDKGLTEKK